MPIAEVDSSGNGIAFLVAAGIVYEIIAAACSSPQTAEINAEKRAATLMKWVHIGSAQAVVFVAIAALADPEHRRAILAGGAMAWVIMYGCYYYAKQNGLKDAHLPATETY